MIQPPCKHYENFAFVECTKRCKGCRDTCKDYKRYQEELKKAHERKNVNRILNDMNHERMCQTGDNAMKRMMKRRKNNG
jgi:NADH:ubiquinone oxidoreductase subunit F (NADH-binding)